MITPQNQKPTGPFNADAEICLMLAELCPTRPSVLFGRLKRFLAARERKHREAGLKQGGYPAPHPQ
jgi:hypothetical protein